MIQQICQERCIGCGQCVEKCPLDTLRSGPDGKAWIAYPEDCMTCYICERVCPVNAVEVDPDRGYFPPVFPEKRGEITK